MRFCTFVIRKYKKEDSAKGNLARSIKADCYFPRARISHRVLRKYLEECCDASVGILAAFEECWVEYKEHERK